MQTENPNKNTSSQIFEQIKSYFENKPEVAAVYIFGSQVKGTEREESDLLGFKNHIYFRQFNNPMFKLNFLL